MERKAYPVLDDLPPALEIDHILEDPQYSHMERAYVVGVTAATEMKQNVITHISVIGIADLGGVNEDVQAERESKAVDDAARFLNGRPTPLLEVRIVRKRLLDPR